MPSAKQIKARKAFAKKYAKKGKRKGKRKPPAWVKKIKYKTCPICADSIPVQDMARHLAVHKETPEESARMIELDEKRQKRQLRNLGKDSNFGSQWDKKMQEFLNRTNNES